MADTHAHAHDELDRLLGIEKPASAADLLKEHGVTEHKPSECLAHTSGELAHLLVRVRNLTASHQVPVLLAGLAKVLKAASAEGPGVVNHLADELLEGAVSLLPKAPAKESVK
jgi:hypothetical protein